MAPGRARAARGNGLTVAVAPLSRRRFLTAATLFGSAGWAAPLLASGSRRTPPWIPSPALLDRLPEILRLAKVPGVSLAVVEEGESVFTGAWGVRRADTGAPVEPTTVFEAASLSKPPVALVALMLRDEGLFRIDRPLVEYVKPAHLLDDPRARRITAVHVMTHCSGLRNWRRPTDEAFPLSFEPGERYQYSGEGFVWLARALEQATGTGFVRLMRDYLFAPLGLGSTTYLWTPSLEGRMATGHDAGGAPTRNSLHLDTARAHGEAAAASGRPVEDWSWEDHAAAAAAARPGAPVMPGGLVPNAAASLLTTAQEYARFTTLILDGPPAIPALGASSRALVHTPHTPVEPPLSWGMGIALEDHDGARLVWHWGNNGDFHSFVVGDVAARRAIVVLANGAGGPKVYRRIVRDAIGFDAASLIWT